MTVGLRVYPERTLRFIRRIEQRLAELEDFDPKTVHERFKSTEVNVLETAIDETLSTVFGKGTADYNRYADAATLDSGPISMRRVRPSEAEVQQYLEEGKKRSRGLLKRAISYLTEQIEDEENEASPSATRAVADQINQNFFIVHGRDESCREAVARFIERVGFRPIILHERPNKGRTIISKFTEEAAGAAFAVVLMTPDDLGGIDSSHLTARARQNVIFELGFFIGALGPSKVAALVKGNLESPSDYDGVVFIPYDGSWQLQLAREMRASGLNIDLNRAIS